MTVRCRTLVFVLCGAVLVALLAVAMLGMPPFGGALHPYRDHAVPAALARHTANAVAAVNFDERGLDTLGEELILLSSVVGATALLRPTTGERQHQPPQDRRVLESTRLAGYLMLPVAMVLGVDLVLHGVATPGGGFQGGVVLATGLHLLYVAGSYGALRKLRPLGWYHFAEAGSALVFLLSGLAGLAVTGAYLANVLPFGEFGQPDSGGLVALLNLAAGTAVGSGVVVLLAQFLRADLHTVGEERT